MCRACRDSLERPATRRWLGTADGVIPWTAAVPYEKAAAVVLGYKERGIRRLGVVLADLLIAAVAEHSRAESGNGEWGEPPFLAAIPSSEMALLRRGEDTWLRVCRLAHRRGMRSHVGGVGSPMRWSGPVGTQKALGRHDRRVNVSGRLRLRPGVRFPPGSAVIVADDVVTTGATVLEAARVLRASGCRVAGAVSICGSPEPAT